MAGRLKRRGAALGLALAGCLPACGFPMARERELDRPVSLAPVDEVEVRPLGDRRWTASVLVRGTLPDGCTRLDRVRRHRSGRDFEFTISTVREPSGGCSPEPQAWAKSLTLYLEPVDYGQYRAVVNGVARSFYVSGKPGERGGIIDFPPAPAD